MAEAEATMEEETVETTVVATAVVATAVEATMTEAATTITTLHLRLGLNSVGDVARYNQEPGNDVASFVSHSLCLFKITHEPTSTAARSDGILVDTGASAHILYNRSYFKEMDPKFVPSQNFLELADGSTRNDLIEGRGPAIIPITDVSGVALQGA